MKACVYEAIVHSVGAYLLFSFLLQLLVQDQLLRRNIANVPRSLDETDHVTNNTIYLVTSILPEDLSNIPELMFLQLPNNLSELLDHDVHVEAVALIRLLFLTGWWFTFSVNVSF